MSPDVVYSSSQVVADASNQEPMSNVYVEVNNKGAGSMTVGRKVHSS